MALNLIVYCKLGMPNDVQWCEAVSVVWPWHLVLGQPFEPSGSACPDVCCTWEKVRCPWKGFRDEDLICKVSETKITIIQVTQENSKFQWIKKKLERNRIFDSSCLQTIMQVASPLQKYIPVCKKLLLARYDFQMSHMTLFAIEHVPILDVKLHIPF